MAWPLICTITCGAPPTAPRQISTATLGEVILWCTRTMLGFPRNDLRNAHVVSAHARGRPRSRRKKMNPRMSVRNLTLTALAVSSLFLAGQAVATDIRGQVLGGGAPIAKSTVTLWEASADAPKQLGQAKTNDDGRFEVRAKGAHSDAVLYLVANGGVAKASKASRRQSRYRAAGGCGQQSTGERDDQRTHHRGVGVHQCAIHQWRRHFRQSAWTQDRCRKCSQPGRSRDRRMGQGAA